MADSSVYADMHTADGALKLYLEGEWRESASGKTVAIGNPCEEGSVAFKVQGPCVLRSGFGLSLMRGENGIGAGATCRRAGQRERE